MQYSSLTDLPSAPRNKSGWPWTEMDAPFPPAMPNGAPWPRVSIVTPSYNQGPYLEETIRSILLQGYPNLEYIIMDGGSTDESIDIICKYSSWLKYWTSKRDLGQSDAINQGFSRATGEIFAWLNSDDLYEPNTLRLVSNHFLANPECALLYGKGWYINVSGEKTYPCVWVSPFRRKRLSTFNFILQPAAFWRRWLWENTGELDISLNWTMDWEWFLRATKAVEPHYLRKDLARWRISSENKTVSGGQSRRQEIAKIAYRYGGFWQPTYLDYWLDQNTKNLADRLGNRLAGRGLCQLMTAFRWMLEKTIWRGLYLP